MGHAHHSHSHDHSVRKFKMLPIVVFAVVMAYVFVSLSPSFVNAPGYSVDKVVEVGEHKIADNGLFVEESQTVKLKNLPDDITYVISGESKAGQLLKSGDRVVVVQDRGADSVIAEKYRLPALAVVLLVFVVVAVWFSGVGAIYSFLALAFSVWVLVEVVLKMILAGYNTILATLLGALLISIVSVYLGHGFKRRTHIAIVGMLATLTISTFLAVIFVKMASLFGMGSEEALYLQLDAGSQINLQGLLLAGIIIGTLGVLDDITTSQVAVVDELCSVNSNLSVKELYEKGLNVGKEHIAALINTLVLAYAGAALPLFVLFAIESRQPVWIILNSEFMAEEVMRTIVGSIALVLAVPLTTYLAARFLKK